MASTQEYMATGYGPIDAEHAQISGHLRALLGAVNAGDVEATRSVLCVVSSEVAGHFAHEEQLMAQWAYPKAARHRDAHATFLKDAAQFTAELEAQGLTPKFRRWVLTRLMTWFQFHIVANDVELGMFLREQSRRAGQRADGEPAST